MDIKSTLKDGTPSTFFREITEFKCKVLVDVIGARSPLGIITGGKVMFCRLLTSRFGKEVIWSVAPLSRINRLGIITGVCNKPGVVSAAFA